MSDIQQNTTGVAHDADKGTAFTPAGASPTPFVSSIGSSIGRSFFSASDATPRNEPEQSALKAASGLENLIAASTISWKGSPNFWSGRNNQPILAICDHIMEGTLETTNDWFKNRRSEVSSHFGVGQDGRIWQWVHADDTAWANGIMQSPDTSLDWLNECVQKGINPNQRTISIEHEGHSGKPWPEKQYQATLWLHRFLCATYNIKSDRQHIVGHYQIMAHDRANCPGSTFPWQRLITDLGNTPVPANPPASADHNPLPPPLIIPPPLGKPAPADDPASTVELSRHWASGVNGVVWEDFGPGLVLNNNSFVRNRPSLGQQDGTLLHTVNRGRRINFVAYSDAGPVFRQNPRWLLIAENDGGGWVHSSQVALPQQRNSPLG